MTRKINGTTFLIEIEGTIVGSYALDLDQLIISTNFAHLGISNLVLNLSRASMIDSIGIEVINHAQKQGFRVSILEPRGLVKDMLERARLKEQLLPFVQIVPNGSSSIGDIPSEIMGNERILSARKESYTSTELPVPC